MKKIITLFFVLPFVFSAYCQSETDNWYFGTFAGVNFNSGTPTVLTNGAINTNEGSSSISDAGGNLLFYTDGVTVWNSNHVPMPNGNGLVGDVSSTQSALIVKQPLSTNLYYLFTTDELGGPDGFCYSIIDMTLDGGLGDVTATKNILIQNHVTEKLCGVNAANDSDVWVMVHGFGNDGFYAYKLTSAGLNVTPVISNTGTIHDSTQQSHTYGYMKFSPDGHKVGVAIGYLDIAEVFDFDNQSGMVSNPINFNIGEHCYGVEFSPDNSKFYLTHYSNLTQNFFLDQFDLSAGTPADIIASQHTVVVFSDPDNVRALQLASNRKIYVAKSGTPFLGVINDPNLAGALCFYQDNVVMLDGGFGNTCMLGLPNLVASYFAAAAPVSAFYSSDSSVCKNGCINFTDASTNAPDSWSWFFDGGLPVTSSAQNPGPICYLNPGVYDVTLITTNASGTDTLNFPGFITVNAFPAQPTVTLTGNILSSSLAGSYQWYLDSVAIVGATNQTYTATQPGSYYVVVMAEGGCESASTETTYFPEGINEMLSNGISIYPNPVESQFTVGSLQLAGSYEISVLDLVGRKIFTQTSNSINVSALVPGIYLLEIKTVTATSVAKFLKR